MDAHNITMDTFCQSPITTYTQGENAKAVLTSEIINDADTLAEMLKGLKINDTGYYNSHRNDAEGFPASYPKVAMHNSDGNKRKVTDTRNGNLQQKLLTNQTLLIITMPIYPQITDRVAICVGDPHALTTTTMKTVITDAEHSSAPVLQNPHRHVRRTGRNVTTPRDREVSGLGKGPVFIGGIVPPTRTGSPEIVNPHGSAGSVGVMDTQIFNTSIDRNLAKNGDSTPIFSKVIRKKLSHDSISDIYLRCRVDFTSNTIRNEAPDFMHLGILAFNASDELRSFVTPATRFGRPADVSNWYAPGHVFG